ncbi:cytochrome c maturation protein CcmE [Aurantiacibacter odishensis]|uniref:cytochrome c maturation protein CcmE n=1 Tax=Aurantiacibacter odishensis TaxID=1155476 RepID=UPI000E74C66E|nr:cytochrome c maturation protein CcmE [Aurantiacibacter odishensis]
MSDNASRGLKPKHQRLVLVVIALVAIVGAGFLAAYALSNQASYFYVPADIEADPPEAGQAIRLGGMVENGSINTAADGVTVEFVVQDGQARVPVSYTGIVPALFVEGSGVVAEGAMRADGVFIADNLLAKHDENYMPRELEGMSSAELREELQESIE